MGFPMNDFARLLEAQIPRLRRYARALTRDVSQGDDLVQSCLARAAPNSISGNTAPICGPGSLRFCTISTSTKCAVRYVKAPM